MSDEAGARRSSPRSTSPQRMSVSQMAPRRGSSVKVGHYPCITARVSPASVSFQD